VVHGYKDFVRGENLYLQAIAIAKHHSEIIMLTVAMAGLYLAQGNYSKGMPMLDKILQSHFIKASKNNWTEGTIIKYIHCTKEEKFKTLCMLKQLLIMMAIRPKLILMFDTNVEWAKQQSLPDYDLIVTLVKVYNCEVKPETLNKFPEWKEINVDIQADTVDITKIHELDMLLSLANH